MIAKESQNRKLQQGLFRIEADVVFQTGTGNSLGGHDCGAGGNHDHFEYDFLSEQQAGISSYC